MSGPAYCGAVSIFSPKICFSPTKRLRCGRCRILRLSSASFRHTGQQQRARTARWPADRALGVRTAGSSQLRSAAPLVTARTAGLHQAVSRNPLASEPPEEPANTGRPSSPVSGISPDGALLDGRHKCTVNCRAEVVRRPAILFYLTFQPFDTFTRVFFFFFFERAGPICLSAAMQCIAYTRPPHVHEL